MNEKLLDLSERTEHFGIIPALQAVSQAAASLNISFFIVGAVARDLILQFYRIQLRRGTSDLDLGVRVSSWDEYDKLIDHLIDKFGFERLKQIHKISFKGTELDIIPFGDLSDENGKIHWPKQSGVMSVIGFEDAHKSSLLVRLSRDPDLDVRVCTLPGLAILKLVAWDEKYPERPKDAADLLSVMDDYDATGNTDRLFEEESALLIEEQHDHTMAGIRLLGRDMSVIADDQTFATIHAILSDESKRERLAAQMSSSDFDAVMTKIEKLILGLESIAHTD
jgi:predicted nucleotidyltransferase